MMLQYVSREGIDLLPGIFVPQHHNIAKWKKYIIVAINIEDYVSKMSVMEVSNILFVLAQDTIARKFNL